MKQNKMGSASMINKRLKKAKTRERIVRLEEGKYEIDKTIYIPSNVKLVGSGVNTELYALGNFPVISFSNVENASLEKVKISRKINKKCKNLEETDSYCRASNGISIHGKNINIRKVWIEDCFNAVFFEYEKNKNSTNVILKKVKSTHKEPTKYTSLFGLHVNSVNNLLVEDCHWEKAWLDGIKLRYECSNVVIKNGSSNKNGSSFKKGYAGDGIDCFAGGRNITIEGTEFCNNGGNGIVIKTKGGYNPKFGTIENYTIKGVKCLSNKGSGLSIEGVYDSTSLYKPNLDNICEDKRDRAKDISIYNSSFLKNKNYGIFINGIDINLSNSDCYKNKQESIRIAENSENIRINNCQIFNKKTNSPILTIEKGAKNISINI